MQLNSIHALREKVTRRENATEGITAQNTQLRNFSSRDVSMTISQLNADSTWDYLTRINMHILHV